MRFHIIVATDLQNGIARRQQIPWHCPEDLQVFKKITTDAPPGLQNVVIMGRKTFESLRCRTLPNRHNIILSSNPLSHQLTPLTATSILNAIDLAESLGAHEAFFIGGEQVYREAFQHAPITTLYKSVIPAIYDCDRFFPEIPESFIRVDIQDMGGFSLETWKNRAPIL